MTKKTASICSLGLIGIYFINGCAMIEKTETTPPKQAIIEVDKAPLMQKQTYGIHTNDIQVLLDATPIGSEISLEEGENGEWCLKIEKVFTVENRKHQELEFTEEPSNEETSDTVNIYDSETILI